MDKLMKNTSYIILIFLLIAGMLILYNAPNQKIKEVPLSELVTQINENKVKKIEVDGTNLKIELQDGTKEKAAKEMQSSLGETLNGYGVDKNKLRAVDVKIKQPSVAMTWAGIILPFLLPFLLIAGFIWFMMRQAQRGNSQALSFGLSKARMLNPKDKKRRLTFKDVAGNKEAKEEMQEFVDFLRHPQKFLKMGARIPKGMLLLGPPGTGKTLMAKAIAGEANVPFFNISGSEFVEMFVGVGASRVRDLFKQAKKNAPSIIFIDEIDAVGRHRGAGLGGGHDEREQTLNQILVEMDGFETDTNVIVIAATNRPDVLDPALLRPGRFDRRITLDLPDIKDREAILEIHAKNKPLAKNVNLKIIAQRTPGFSGADLANLLNEAAILAARKGKRVVHMEELIEAIEKVLLGPERKSAGMNKEEKKIVAYHEAGHALIGAILPEADPIQKVSIISRGRAGGYTLAVPEKDIHLHSKLYFQSEMAVLLGGYVAEKEIFGEEKLTTGASNDLERATHMARDLVTRYGMSSLGPRTFGKKEELIFLGKEINEEKDYAESTAEKIDQEVSRFIQEAEEKAIRILKEKMSILEKLAQTLLKKETIEKEEFDQIVFGENEQEENLEEKKNNSEIKK